MTEMLKGVCIIVIIVCVGVMIYAILNAIKTYKENKAKDEASQRIFLAKIKQTQGVNSQAPAEQIANNVLKQPFSFEPARPKTLNYDEFEEDPQTNIPNDKGLKDFFKS